MPRFAYTAVDQAGVTVTGTHKENTIGDLRTWLVAKQLFPVAITEPRSRFEIELTKKKLKKRELMHFSRQMAVFVKAGIAIITALETIADEATDKVLRGVIRDIIDLLEEGYTFADAAAEHPEAFPGYYLGVLRSAELTGDLDGTLDNLATYLDRELQSKAKIVAALVYPCVVMVMAVCTIVLLAVMVLPPFKTLFEEMDADLPIATRLLLGMVGFFTTMWFVPVGLGLLSVAAMVWMAKTVKGKRTRDALILKLPAIGEIMQYSILERFCRILATMTSAGVPLPESMEVTSEATNNAIYREKLAIARQEMLDGKGLGRPLIATGLFPGAVRQMMMVGEESGTLDEQLAMASLYLDRELEVKVRKFTAAFEPATILFVGACVGFVAIALVQAMYGMLGGMEE